MFLGQYRHSLDKKGRLTIPARYRELLVGGAFMIQGLDQNIMVMTNSGFTAYAKRISEESVTNPDARFLARIVFSKVQPVDVDTAGRILIPSSFREFANLDGEAVIVGVGSYFEIWSPDQWDKQTTAMNTESIAERFIAFNIPAGQ